MGKIIKMSSTKRIKDFSLNYNQTLGVNGVNFQITQKLIV